MVGMLESVRPREESRIEIVMHELAGRLKRRGLVIIISDLLKREIL